MVGLLVKNDCDVWRECVRACACGCDELDDGSPDVFMVKQYDRVRSLVLDSEDIIARVETE